MTASKIIPISQSFWNIRGDLRIAGVLNVGTHMSLAKRANGKYLLLDACELDAEGRAFIDRETDGGKAIEAVLHLHPFHTLFVKALHEIYPHAKLYGTTRHKSRALELPWQPELTNEAACHALFADDFDFTVPRGVDFIPANPNLHFSSVLAFHRASRTLHVDDTLCYVRLPKLLRSIKEDMIGFHPSLSKVLERRAGAVSDFRAWTEELVAHSRDLENLCTAHLHVLSSRDGGGPSIAERIEKAVRELTASWPPTSDDSAERKEKLMGGTIDPKTGEVVWQMHVPAAEQLAYYRSHPPRAISGVRATPIEVEFQFDGHGEPINSIFEVACPCGSAQFTVSGGLDEDDEIRPPIELACSECEAVYDVFDSNEHGFDGELLETEADYPEPDDYNELHPTEFEAPHEIVIRFEYGSEELGSPDRAAEWRGREQDLFTWFTLLARDPETKQLAFLYDSECA